MSSERSYLSPRNNLPERLARVLHGPLPGPDAQLLMAPLGRRLPVEGMERRAAVLIALFEEGGCWRFPLIHRVEDGYAHGGQIGLPGGTKEDRENPEQTALREANEEVGILPENVHLLGRLSSLPIPISGYKVKPVVGILGHEPEWRADPREVQTILLTDVNELLDPTHSKRELWTLHGREVEVPFFDLAGRKVWGATAMILSEFRTILEKALG